MVRRSAVALPPVRRRRRVRARLVLLAAVLGACSSGNEPFLVAPPTTVATVGNRPVGTGDGAAPDPACASVPGGLQETTVEGGGVVHPVRIFVPPAFRGTRLPAVVSFHGLGSDAAGQAALTGFEELATTEGFLVVQPTGVPNAGDPRAGWQLVSSPPDPSHDDVAFARVLLDEIVNEWCADSTRLYVAGMSNGGFFATRLICELGDRIAGALAVGGVSFPDGCAPLRPVPLLAFHGTADDFVPYDGNGVSVLAGTGDLPGELFDSQIPAEVGAFAAAAGCAPTPTSTPFDATMVRYAYQQCRDGSLVTLVEMVDGGHVWPRRPAWPIDATVDGWAFLSQFAL
jgi:polyhydroxybutyrate depolymerase